MNKKLNFAITDIHEIPNDDIDQDQFSLLSIDAFSTEPSLHKTVVSEEVLRNTSKTILQKPFVFELNKFGTDMGTHSIKEIPAGFIPANAPLNFRKLSNGYIMFNTQVLVWKRYSGQLLEFFQRDGGKKGISVEIEIYDSKDSSDGLTELLDFCYTAVTCLGDAVRSAIPNANAVMVFSEEFDKAKQHYEFSSKYGNIDFTIPAIVKNNAKNAVDNHRKNSKGATAVALAVARHLVNNDKATPEKIKQIYGYFKNKDLTNDDNAHNFYGGKQSYKWAKEIYDKMGEIDNTHLSYFGEGGDPMPYSSLKEANAAIRGIDPPVTLAQANAIAKQADAVGQNDKVNGWAVAIASFKKTHTVKDGKWVNKQNNAVDFAKEDWGKGKVLKVDKSKDKMVTGAWGDVDKTELMHKVLNAANYKTLVKAVYLLVDSDWEDHPSSSLHYPVMQLKGDTFVYNRYGLAAALQRAQGQNETEVVSKVKGLYKKLGIDDGSENKKKEAMSMADEEKDKKPKEGSPEEERQETPEEEKKEQEEGKGDKKNYSLASYVDVEGLLNFLQEETDESFEMAGKIKAAADRMGQAPLDDGSDGDNDDDDGDYFGTIMGGMYAKMCEMSAKMKKMAADADMYMAENAELKKKFAEQEEKQKEFAVDSFLTELDKKVVINPTQMSEMKEKSKEFSLSTIDGWKNHCKAFSFDFPKKEEANKDGILRMALVNPYLMSGKGNDSPYPAQN